jgi:hypothetical protein
MSNEVTMIKSDVASIELVANGMEMRNVAQVFGFSELLKNAGMLPKGINAEGATVAIIAGRALGLDPFQAVQSIAVVNGRPTLWGDAMVAVVKASGLVEDERVEYVKEDGDCIVRYKIKRKGVPTPYEGSFSMKEAEKANLMTKDVWKQYPKRMLFNRARAYALRDGFADVLKGFRCYEEERDVVDAETVAEPFDEKAEPKRKRAPAAKALEAAAATNVSLDTEATTTVHADVDAVPMPM